MVRKILFCLSLMCFLTLSHCGKKDTSSSIQINFNSKGVSGLSLEAKDIRTIIVNVTGPGIKKTIYSKKECHQVGEICSSIAVDQIPSGKERLIQLLVVANAISGDDDSGVVYYGDVLKNLSGSSLEPVGISISEKARFENDSRFLGRYKPALNHPLKDKLLTGKISMAVFVESSKPDMKVGEFEIFGGYFRTFLLDSIKFKYNFSGVDMLGNSFINEPLFDDIHNGTGLNIESMTPYYGQGVAEKVQYSGDIFYETANGFNANKKRKFRTQIIAFLGESISQGLCYNTPAQDYDGSQGFSSICKTVSGTSCSSYLNWSNDLTTELSAGQASCSALKWKLNPKKVNFPGQFAGFYGAITNRGLGTPLIQYANQTLSWKTSTAFNASGGVIDVFTKNDTNFTRDSIEVKGSDQGINCSILTANGFTKRSLLKTGTNYRFQLTDDDLTHWQNQSLNLVFCPRKENQYFNTALLFQAKSFVDPDSFPSKVSIKKIISGQSYINENACVPLEVALLNGSDQQSSSTNSVQVNLSTDGSLSGSFYSDASCSISIGSVNTKDRAVVFYSANSDGAGGNLIAQDNASALTSSSLSITNVVDDSGVYNKVKIFPDFSRNSDFELATTEECALFKVVALDANDEPAQYSGSTGPLHSRIKINGGAPANLFYTNDDCSTADTGSLNFSASDHSMNLHLKGSDYSSADVLTTNFPVCGVDGATCDLSTINVVEPEDYNHFTVEHVDGTLNSNTCIIIKVQSFDNHKPNSYPTNFPDSSSISISSSGAGAVGGEFKTAGCATSLGASAVAASTASTTSTFYYETPAIGSLSLSFEYKGETKEIDLSITP